MGFFDFLKRGGKSTNRSKETYRKKKASGGEAGKLTRAEKSVLNKKEWAEKSAGGKVERTHRKSTTSESGIRRPTKAERSAANKKAWAEKTVRNQTEPAATKRGGGTTSPNESARTKQSTTNEKTPPSNPTRKAATASSQSSAKLTRAERSVANKKAWAEKSAQEKFERTAHKSGDPSASHSKKQDTLAEKLTRAERSALNKRAWEEDSAHANADRAGERLRDAETRVSSSKRANRPQPHSPSVSTSSSAPESNLTRAERSAANKKAWAEKQEKEQSERKIRLEREKLAKGLHTRRRDVFDSKAEYDKYLRSQEWNSKRQITKERAQGRCEICGKAGSDVHHRRYSAPGKEKTSHLRYVCRSCHRSIHGTGD